MAKENLKVDSIAGSPETFQFQLETFLGEHGWIETECPTCQREYYSKGNRQDCGDFACTSNFDFLTDSRKERVTSPVEVDTRFKSYFENLGYKSHPAKSILNNGGTTLFTSAGVQILDDCILREASLPGPLVVSQPSLRTQYVDSIAEGNSLSFVNICTESVNATPEEYFANLDQWLGFLSKLGLFAGDITLHQRHLKQKWGNLTLQSEIIALFYKGLEIGDGNYDHSFNPKASRVSTISDFGFGLERLNWILNKRSYFDVVGPLTESMKGNNFVQEMAKTLTLLAASGLEPSNKDKGYRYRLFAKKMVDCVFPNHMDLPQLVNYYYKYWSNFVDLPTPPNTTHVSVQKEYDRNYNQVIGSALSIGLDTNCSTEEYLANLLRSGVKRDQLVQLIAKV